MKNLLPLRLLLGAATFGLLSTAPAPAQTYQQVWADEFDNGLSPSWKFETGGGGWGNNEKQFYQAANATVAGGELRITARRENVGGMPYTSARLKTEGLKEFTYGKVEARIKMPLGQGLWPAFWMLGSNIGAVGWPKCGEIDVMEHINAENKVYGTIHWDSNGHAQYGGNTTTTPADYHIYSVEWTPTFIKWFVDGNQYHVVDITNGVGGTEEFQRPFFLLLNLAVAGDWPGPAVDESTLPATLFVDYVRVYQLTSTPPPPPATGGVATVYRDCNYGGAAVSLPVGDYPLSQLLAKGVLNDDISSLRVSAGYEVQLFTEDNFQGAALTVGADNSCLVGAGWNDRASSLKVRAAGAGSSSVLLQAEAANVNNGMVAEPCADAGGGQDMGYVDAGDYLVFNNITFPTSGAYLLEYRVASPNGGTLSSDLNAGSLPLGNVAIPATGGWQSWTTVSRTVTVNAGTYSFGIYAQTGGWNINWIRISRLSTASSAAAAALLTTPDPIPAAELSLYPNPVAARLTLAGANEFVGGQARILSVTGQQVWRGAYDGRPLDVASLQPGLYTLVLEAPGQPRRVSRFAKE